MIDKSCVYWIHLPEHTDIFTQGYVGVSKVGAEARYRQHLRDAKSGKGFKIHCAILKYGDKLIVETVIEAQIEYCYDIELKLRPTPHIGYNIVAGGISGNLGVLHSKEAKLKISIAGKGRVCSDTTKDKMRLSAKGISKETRQANIKMLKTKVAWKAKFADKSTWLMASKIYQYMEDNPLQGIRNVGKGTDILYTKLRTIFKKIRSGWNPLEDTEWLIFSSELTPDTSGDKSNHPGILPIKY